MTKRLFIWGIPLISLVAGLLSSPRTVIVAPQRSESQSLPVIEETSGHSFVAELETHSSEGFRRLVENGRVNRCQSVDHWSVADPAACYAWIMSQHSWHWIRRNTGGMMSPPDSQLQRLYFTWAELDPKAALEGVAKARYHANMGCGEVLWHLLQIDPLGTLPLYAEYGDRGGYGWRTGSSTWVRGDLPRLVEAVAALPPSFAREGLLVEALAGLAKQDPAAALQWMGEQPTKDRATFSAVIKGWATRDSAAAVAYLTTQATDQERRWAAREVVGILAEKSPELAWQVAQELHQVVSAGVTAVNEWRRRDSAAAAAAVAALPNPQDRDRVCMQLTNSGWTHQNLDLWMDFMPAPLRERFLQEVTNNWARNNFPAINEFLATAPVEQITPEVIKAAARHWSDHPPNKASIEWAANLPEAYRSTAMFEVLDHVYNTPDPVKEALKNITDPVLKEMAIKALGPKAPPQ